MRIAFDLDDTLIPALATFPVENPAFRPWQLIFGESLRQGTRQLICQLRKDGHEIWIYTTSQRSAFYLRTWFCLLRTPLAGVVNGRRHEEWARSGTRLRCSKYPPAFGIDLLIDDSEGVAQEGLQCDFRVYQVDPANVAWAEEILDAVVAYDD